MTPQLNRLVETVQLRGHNIFFMHNQQKLSLIITKYSLLSSALSRLAVQSLYATFGAHVKTYNRILDKREYLMIIFLISSRNQAKFMTILSFDLQV